MQQEKAPSSSIRVKDMVLTALMAAVLCVMSPWSLNIGPVPVSLSLFAIYLTLHLLGWKKGTVAVLLYILIGLVGIPVFSNFTGGPGKLFGPTGGFILGYIPMALLTGLLLDFIYEKTKGIKALILTVIGSFVCTWVLYLLGTLWYMFSAGVTFLSAMSITVLPFLLIDLLKNILAAVIAPVIRNRTR